MIAVVHENPRATIEPMLGTYRYTDLAALPEDGLRRELLDGELLVSPSPVRRHQRILLRLALAISDHLGVHGGGELFVAPFDVVLADSTVLQPDLLLITEDQTDISTEKNIRGAPTLVIEIVSDSRVDRVRKRDLYERYGVKEYWIVDPDADRVEVLRRDGDRYARPIILELRDSLSTPLLEGLTIDLAAIFIR